MTDFKIVYYRNDTGHSPLEKWYERLDGSAATKVYAALMRIEAGNSSDSKRLNGGIWERRIHSGPGYRLYYGIERRRYVVMLAGGTKRTQRGDISKATKRWYEYKNPTS
jgi:putative addiction module killer protein